MGIFKGGILFFLGITLLITLLFANFFLTINLSLGYENVKEEIVPFIESESQEGIGLGIKLENEYLFASSYCMNNTNYVFKYDEYVFDIPCEVVSQGIENTTNYGTNQLIDKIYYKDYQCSFLSCLLEGEYLLMVSEESKDYWKGKFITALFISLIIIGIVYFLSDNKSGATIETGLIIILSSLPFMKISSLLSFLDTSFLQVIPLLFSKSYSVFLTMFATGILLTAIGIFTKFFNITNYIVEKFSNKKE